MSMQVQAGQGSVFYHPEAKGGELASRLMDHIDHLVVNAHQQVAVKNELKSLQEQKVVLDKIIVNAEQEKKTAEQEKKILEQRNEHLKTNVNSIQAQAAEKQKRIDQLKALQEKRKLEAALKQQATVQIK